jgi:hypothetical protein
MLSFLFGRNRGRSGRSSLPQRFRPGLEQLEDRVVPYALSGFTWANTNVSVSFMPDGTLISSSNPSNLFSVYNAAYPQATWQREVARALQSWADVCNLNFHFVADDGSPQGTAGLAQGDSRFGDIRIGGYNMGSGILGIGWNPNSTTTGGDVELNTSSAFVIGSMPDLASIVMHEVGHGIGFNHSLVDPAVMEGGLWGTYPGPYADDIAGVQAMYGARKPDVYDVASPNNTLATATPLTLTYGGVTLQADITTMADVDYYKVTAPAGTDGTLTVSVDARNLSLFDPKVSVYDSSGTLLGTASASTYGDVATVKLTGLVAGQTYYFQAAGATTDVFGMGAYKLTAQFGGISAPAIGPDQFEANNTVASATNFGTVTSLSQTALTLNTTSDVDYYTAAAGSKTTYTMTITPTQGTGILSMSVLNASQTVLASGQSQTGGFSLSVSLTSGQQYYVKVFSPSGGLFVYNLSIAKAGATGGGGGGGGGGSAHKLVPAGDFFWADGRDEDAPDATVSDAGQAPSTSRSQESSPSRAPVSATAFAGGELAARFIQDGAGTQHDPAGALPSFRQQAAQIVSVATPVPARVFMASTSVGGSDLGPLTPAESDGSDAILPSDTDAVQAAERVSTARPVGELVDAEAIVPAGVKVRQQAFDACFTDDSQSADPDGLKKQESAQAEQYVSLAQDAFAAAALVVFLGGSVRAHRAEADPRSRRRFQM